jgi:hypothetical protein
MKAHGKPRFISKYTDFPRLNYLRKVFPEATFIHITRDARAVINSYHQKVSNGTFQTWVDPEERAWWIRGWPKAWRRAWKRKWAAHPDASLAFAAFQWAYIMREIREELHEVNELRETGALDYAEVRYERLVRCPAREVRRLIEGAGLLFDARTEAYLRNAELKNKNHKWRECLSDRQKRVLNDIIEGKRKRAEPNQEPNCQD